MSGWILDRVKGGWGWTKQVLEEGEGHWGQAGCWPGGHGLTHPLPQPGAWARTGSSLEARLFLGRLSYLCSGRCAGECAGDHSLCPKRRARAAHPGARSRAHPFSPSLEPGPGRGPCPQDHLALISPISPHLPRTCCLVGFGACFTPLASAQLEGFP